MAQLKEIKSLIKATGEKVFLVVYDDIECFYSLKYEPSSEILNEWVHTQRGTLKRYKSLDAVHADCKNMAGNTYMLKCSF